MWSNPKYKNPFYSRMVEGEKPFELYGETAKGDARVKPFKSWQAAKKAGWKKVK